MTKEQIIQLVNPEVHPNSLAVMKKRYMRVDEKGQAAETPADMFYRVASAIARQDAPVASPEEVDKITADFYQILARLDFLPGGRALFEAGNNYTGQLSSCFVLPIDDSLTGIFESLKEAAIVQKNNGGTGFNFSHIRPKGDEVNGITGVAAGPIHYLRTFDQAFSQLLQGSKRHGGNMGILNVNHPDIEEFIQLKDRSSGIRNFNISVGVTRDFMERVRNDQEYDLINPRTKQPVKKLRARVLFHKIVERAWECADPGMIFLDEIEGKNPTPHLGVIEATNPCGEEPLRAYESCNLGSINLSHMVKPTAIGWVQQGTTVTLADAHQQIDWTKLEQTIKTATHFLDNMIDASRFPLEQITREVKATRKLGLGIMGFAQMLFELGIPYGSEEAVQLCDEIMHFVEDKSIEESVRLAETRGAFPGFEGSTWQKRGLKVRNATMTSIAPTGTISMAANTSSGIEPVFALAITRKTFFEQTGNQKGGTTMTVVDGIFERVAKLRGFYSDELMKQVAASGSLENVSGIPEDIRRVFQVSHEIHFEWHVKMQGAAQKWTDAAVSKTINFPTSATVEEVARAYIMAYELGCKGVTVYRDGSKQSQVLNVGHKAKEKSEVKNVILAGAGIHSVDSRLRGNDATALLGYTDTPAITPNALTVLQKRALLKDETGQVVETPEQMFRRVAHYIAGAERLSGASEAETLQWEEKFYGMLSRLEFISGQAIRNAGTSHTLSACLVLPIEDSLESILRAISENAIAHKSTCGTGFNFSRLRAEGSPVGDAGNIAAGPVTYMKALAQVQKTVQTKGGRSQGSMGILNIDHPDIEKFITAKDDLKALGNMNISVGVTDIFMEALRNDSEYDLVDPHTGKSVCRESAKKIFDMISKHAWVSGDPGVIFVDRLERDNPTPTLGKLDATNPCGEQPLIPYETCNLGSIILSRMLKAEASPDSHEWRSKIDWNKLKETTYLGVRFLDNTIDVNHFPLKAVEEMSRQTRRIGLGVMGFADLLVKLGVQYNSDTAVEIASEVMKFVQTEAHRASEELGEEKGSFSAFGVSVFPKQNVKARRNSAVTTIAPTGYIAIVANCSSGIEPIFALAFRRQNSMGGTDQVEVHPLFEQALQKLGLTTSEIREKILAEGSCQKITEIPEAVRRTFVTSYDISPEWDVKVQAAFQKYTDNAVSKTINFPTTATVEDIKQVYKQAYDTGCKGVTIYRDGSKEQVLVKGLAQQPTTNNQQPAKENQSLEVGSRQLVAALAAPKPRNRPEVIQGSTYKIKTGYGTLFVTVNHDEHNKPFEVFATIGKTGGVFAAKSEAICRLVSLALRSGIDAEVIIDQIKGIRGPMPVWHKGNMVLSIPDAIAQILQEHIKKPQQQLPLDEPSMISSSLRGAEATKQSQPEIATPLRRMSEGLAMTSVTTVSSLGAAAAPASHAPSRRSVADIGFSPECPDCSAILEMAEGCMTCRGCGYSKCG